MSQVRFLLGPRRRKVLAVRGPVTAAARYLSDGSVRVRMPAPRRHRSTGRSPGSQSGGSGFEPPCRYDVPAFIAQRSERLPCKQLVRGSTPRGGSKAPWPNGSGASLQSWLRWFEPSRDLWICTATGRRSRLLIGSMWVRVPPDPRSHGVMAAHLPFKQDGAGSTPAGSTGKWDRCNARIRAGMVGAPRLLGNGPICPLVPPGPVGHTCRRSKILRRVIPCRNTTTKTR